MILYSATNISELRQRFKMYAAQLSKRATAKSSSTTTAEKRLIPNASGTTAGAINVRRCFNSNEEEHLSRQCLQRIIGIKYFS